MLFGLHFMSHLKMYNAVERNTHEILFSDILTRIRQPTTRRPNDQSRICSQQSPVQKKMWGHSTGAADLIFPVTVSCQFSSKTGHLFLLITLVSLGGRPFFRHAKICRFFCGGPFLWGPVWPNMLNMPKSAAVNDPCVLSGGH